jgi:hypothetical protein
MAIPQNGIMVKSGRNKNRAKIMKDKRIFLSHYLHLYHFYTGLRLEPHIIEPRR